MHIIHYPGEISLKIYKLISISPSGFRTGWRILVALSVIFLGGTTLLKIRYPQNIENLRHSKWLFAPTTFILVVCIGIFTLRLPNLILPEQFLDESQWVINASSYLHGSVFWQSVSGGTGGPLVYTLPIMMMPIDGMNWASVRLFGLLICLLPAIYLVWRIFILLYGENIARLNMIGVFLFFASMNLTNYVSYDSEHLIILFTTIGMYYLYRLMAAGTLSLVHIAIWGLALGLVPFAKLQGVPLGLCIGMMGLYEIARQPDTARQKKLVSVTVMIGAAFLPFLFASVYLTAHHCWGDFWTDYIVANAKYMSTNLGGQKPIHGLAKLLLFFKGLHKDISLQRFMAIQILAIAALMVWRYKTGVKIFYNRIILWGIVILAVAYLSVIAPGNSSLHYILIFMIPYFLLTGGLVARTIGPEPRADRRLYYSLLLFVPLIVYTLQIMRQPTEGFNFVESGEGYPSSAASGIIRRYAHPGERMSIWGFPFTAFIETDLVPGNLHTDPIYAMVSNSGHNESDLEAYVKEMKASRPIVFFEDVSLVASSFHDRDYTFENYPGLKEYISQNYTQVADIDGKRVYISNAREREVDSTGLKAGI